MTDWLSNKGVGPWSFIPQEQKCGYVNNPRWTGAPASPVMHEPCGYWPKSTGGIPNIYGLYEDTPTQNSMWAVQFSKGALTFLGGYTSPDLGMHGFEWYHGNLLAVAGLGATAQLYQLSNGVPFTVTAKTTPFNANDVPASVLSNLLLIPDTQKYFWASYPGTSGARLIRLNNSLQKEARGCYCTVSTGTDGNLYYYYNSYAFGGWDPAIRPITGGSWSTFWQAIPDNACDSPITTWGSGTALSAYGASSHLAYGNGHLFLTLSQSVDDHAIRQIDPNSLAITATASLLFAQRTAVYKGVLYVLYGATTANVKSYNADTLAPIADSGVLPYGRAAYDNADLLVTDEGVTLVTDAYVGTRAFYLLDRNSLSVIKQTTAGTTADPTLMYQRLAVFDQNYLVAATNQGVDIIERGGFTRVATLSLTPLIGGYLQQRVLVGGGSTGLSQGRCGTPPYWPWPAPNL